MKKISYLKALQALKESPSSKLQDSNITLLRNITIEPIEAFIRYYLSEQNHNAICKFGGFDTLFSDSCDQTLVNKSTQAIIIFYDFEFAYRDLKFHIANIPENDLQQIIDDFTVFVKSIVNNIRKNSDAIIIWNSFIKPCFPLSGIASRQNKTISITHFIEQLNNTLNLLSTELHDFYLNDSEVILTRIGHEQFFDIDKGMEYAAPYTNYALQLFAKQFSTFIANLSGNLKKCIVLDCDNTLWGGIIGEDGLENIALGNNVLGKKFQQFQQYLRFLSDNGVILALCSKNNENDVWQVFNNHSEMKLTKRHVSCAKINWQDKASNITEIASQLNIGLSSIVFVDDNPLECEQVNQALPKVTVVQMQADPYATINDLIFSGYFDNLNTTSEDKNKAIQYQQQSKRAALSQAAMSHEAFIKSLNITVDIEKSNANHLKRLAQLSQKTNQFNLTTLRLNQTEVESWLTNKTSDIFSISVQDKFGELGVVGAAYVTYHNKCVVIDNLLLSCRSLGRGIETVFINQLCKHFFNNSFMSIEGVFIESERNQQTKALYLAHGFSLIESTSIKKRFQITNNSYKPCPELSSTYQINLHF